MLGKLAAALVFATGVALIVLADAPFVRHASVGNSYVCSSQQLESLPTHMGAVIMGSSRLRRGVDPDILNTASGGRFTNNYNLARTGRDLVRSSIMFDELLDSGHSIDLLILEMDLDAVRHGRFLPWVWRPNSAGYARWEYILRNTPPTAKGADSPDLRIVLDGLRRKLQQALKLTTTGVVAEVLTTPSVGPTTVCWQDHFDVDRPALARARARALREVQARFPHPETQLDDGRVGLPLGTRARVELQTYAYIREQARRNNVQLIIVHPQSYGEPALGPRAIADVQNLVPEFRFPPVSMTRQLNLSQIDRHHYGPDGRALFTRWLADVAMAEQQPPER